MFITLEGIDGSGKSTQARKLFNNLSHKHGEGNVVWTREPGGWERGDLIRELLLNDSLKHDHSELYLFLVDRCEHVKRVIIPALLEGKIVLCERYTDSTLAYQVWGRGLPFEKVNSLFLWSEFPIPELTLWFDINVDISLERLVDRGFHDRIESGGYPFLRKVRQGYQALNKMYPDRIKRVCAEASEDSVSNEISQIVNNFQSFE